ncbi:MAG: asparaginyl/glutamyl-tRNA amidotransferase subunit C [Candidatus Rokubacteria bacterium RIFCSPLOWO2_12_FULL_71_22]|nr:MAG: asparaginyl/glutamyl-tRNA amidotransferase subunit C [Candidatus Rokubacteria bacterium RIFCSPLOWO2_02_FULL_72_37]OGL14500.1 MAG: asparaginyl/glutamyl-tRNA amidotransferase subunit C [Candidatus Rokubacteria bacterium RIFCSPLOWO2_12_FULL_71_22]
MISRDDVVRVARLARLALESAELEVMRTQLTGILAYIDTLRAVDIEGVEPTAHAVPLVNVMREDVVAPSFALEAMLANAPDRVGGLVRVPRILED